MNDSVRPDGVDASDVEERSLPVEARESSQVTDIAGRPVLILWRPELLPSHLVHQVPRAVPGKPEVVITFEDLRHDRRQAGTTDDDMVVPVKVHDSRGRNHLVLSV